MKSREYSRFKWRVATRPPWPPWAGSRRQVSAHTTAADLPRAPGARTADATQLDSNAQLGFRFAFHAQYNVGPSMARQRTEDPLRTCKKCPKVGINHRQFFPTKVEPR